MFTHRGLGGGREDGRGQLGSVGQTRGQRHTTHRLAGLVFLPAAASQVTAHDRLDGNRLQAFDQHGAVFDLGHFFGRDHTFRRVARQVVWAQVAEFVEPEQRHLREQNALAGNRLTHDDVKGAEAVAGNHQDAVVAHGVVVTHLATGKQRQGGQAGGVQGSGHGVRNFENPKKKKPAEQSTGSRYSRQLSQASGHLRLLLNK